MHLKNIWFNHTFSSEYNIILELKKELQKNHKDVKLIGTSKDINAIYSHICDEFYQESSDIDEEGYIDYALNFCKEHNIGVIFPTRYRLAFAHNYEKFEKLGVVVLVNTDANLLELLEDKESCMTSVREGGICSVSPFESAETIKEFEEKYKILKAAKSPFDNCRICMKYNKDEGAVSFRTIQESIPSIDSLRGTIGTKITYADICSILGRAEKFNKILLMPYLEGIDVSIDSFRGKDSFFAVTRYKLGNRRVLIDINKTFYDLSKLFSDYFNLTGLYNLQLRGHRGKWYFMEINTRMAGGIHKTVHAGVNIPYLAYKDAIGMSLKEDEGVFRQQFGRQVHLTQVETPVLLTLDTLLEKDIENIGNIL